MDVLLQGSLYDIRVKAKDAELVCAHDTRKKLHDEDLVFKRILFV